jgi:hypothetical protein
MDILTPRGLQTLEDEHKAARIWTGHYPAYQYVMTPKEEPAVVDAVLVKDKIVVAVVETKCRYDMTIQDLMSHRNGEWLVTHEKLLKARQVGLGLGVPLVGFLYMVQDKVLLVQKLTDTDGNFVVEMRLEETTTQQTVNGGIVTRRNAFIKMHNASVYA